MIDKNIVTQWRQRCLEKNKSLTQICKTIGISRGLLTKWEKQEPRTLQIVRAINKELE